MHVVHAGASEPLSDGESPPSHLNTLEKLLAKLKVIELIGGSISCASSRAAHSCLPPGQGLPTQLLQMHGLPRPYCTSFHQLDFLLLARGTAMQQGCHHPMECAVDNVQLILL